MLSLCTACKRVPTCFSWKLAAYRFLPEVREKFFSSIFGVFSEKYAYNYA